MKFKFIQVVPGLLLALLIGYASFIISSLHRLFDPLVVGIVLGIFIKTLIGQSRQFEEGFIFTARMFIPVGIVFYGVNLQFQQLTVIPLATWLHLIIGIIIIFGVGIYFGKKLNIDKEAYMLINVGTAICGASAIAMATPTIRGKTHHTGIALLTITIWGIVGVIVYPLLYRYLDMSNDNYALLCASTLHQTGFVKVASGAISHECEQLAMFIKVARTTMIIPMLFFLAWYFRSSQVDPAEKKKFPIPFYLWLFVLNGIVFSFVPSLDGYISYIKLSGAILWTVAMTSLGLQVDIRTLFRDSTKPLIIGFIVWFAIVVNYFIGYFGMGY